MDDDTAYMALVTCNSQSELSALERGFHALGAVEKGKHGKGASAYADSVGRSVSTVKDEIAAAEVAQIAARAAISLVDLADDHKHLVVIHPAPRWLWRALGREIDAAEIASEIGHMADLDPMVRQLAELHLAPRWLWRSLVSQLISKKWSVETARKEAQRLKETPEPPQQDVP